MRQAQRPQPNNKVKLSSDGSYCLKLGLIQSGQNQFKMTIQINDLKNLNKVYLMEYTQQSLPERLKAIPIKYIHTYLKQNIVSYTVDAQRKTYKLIFPKDHETLTLKQANNNQNKENNQIYKEMEQSDDETQFQEVEIALDEHEKYKKLKLIEQKLQMKIKSQEDANKITQGINKDSLSLTVKIGLNNVFKNASFTASNKQNQKRIQSTNILRQNNDINNVYIRQKSTRKLARN